MNKIAGLIAGVSAAAVLAGLSYGSWAVVYALMQLNGLQLAVLALAAVGGGGFGLWTMFRTD